MAEQFELQARIRARAGTSLVRRLRREGEVPAVIYGAEKENQIIAINHDVLLTSLDKEEFHSAIININVEGKNEKAILREVVRHPYKTKVMHADFQRVDENKAITMTMPIHLTGEDDCEGVRNEGGILSRLMTEVEISCLPKDLPEAIELDVTTLALNDSLHLSDIQLPEGVSLTAFSHAEGEDVSEYDYAVVSVLAPKRQAAAEETTEESADAEGASEEGNSEAEGA